MAESLFGKELQGFGFFRKKPEPFVRNIVLNEISYKKRTVPLKIPLDVEIRFDGKEYRVFNEETCCYGYDKRLSVAYADFCSYFLTKLDLAEEYGRKGNDFADNAVRHVVGYRCRSKGELSKKHC